MSEAIDIPVVIDPLLFSSMMKDFKMSYYSSLPLTKSEIEDGISVRFPFVVLFEFPVDAVRACYKKAREVLSRMGTTDPTERHQIVYAVCAAVSAKRRSYVCCNSDLLCRVRGCPYYHPGLFPCGAKRGGSTGAAVEFPVRAMPYNRDPAGFFAIEDPVMRVQQVNARRGEVGAMCVVDLHFLKACHVAWVLGAVFRDRTWPVEWQPDRRRYLWLSCGAGKSGRGEGRLVRRVREWLEASGYRFREAEVNGAVGGFRVEVVE